MYNFFVGRSQAFDSQASFTPAAAELSKDAAHKIVRPPVFLGSSFDGRDVVVQKASAGLLRTIRVVEEGQVGPGHFPPAIRKLGELSRAFFTKNLDRLIEFCRVSHALDRINSRVCLFDEINVHVGNAGSSRLKGGTRLPHLSPVCCTDWSEKSRAIYFNRNKRSCAFCL